MGTETFLAFDSSGSAWKLKGRILRHLSNDPVTDADKTAIRQTLGITSQGGLGDLLAANNLDDVASAATSRTNLDVNSTAQDAESDGTKLVGPTMRFDGSNDYVEFVDNDAFTFSSGTDDTPFSLSAWVKLEDATSGTIISKFGAGASTREYRFYVDSADFLILDIRDTSGNSCRVFTNTAMTGYENQWIHVAAGYTGSGPNSATAFANAADAMSLYVNGKSVAITKTNNASYAGMSNTSESVVIGRRIGANYLKGEIRDVKLFNKALSAAEVKTLCLSGQLPESFAESTGTIAYVSDFSAGVDGFSSAVNGTTDGNIDSIGGEDNNLRFTCDSTSGSHYARRTVLTVGKSYKVEFDFYIPSSNSNLDGLWLLHGSSATGFADSSPAKDTWLTGSASFTAVNSQLRWYGTDGGTTSFQDAGGDDVFYVRNVRVTQIGAVLDARAEQFDTSTGKLYDLSGNDFVGTNNGVTLLGREFPVYETGTWTPSITFGGGSTGITYSAQEGTYTRIGDTVHLAGIAHVSGLGSATGTARVSGLPYTTAAFSPTGSYQTVPVLAFDATGLTSALIGLFEDSQPDIILYQTGSSGGSAASHSNFTTSTSIRFSGTYQIQ